MKDFKVVILDGDSDQEITLCWLDVTKAEFLILEEKAKSESLQTMVFPYGLTWGSENFAISTNFFLTISAQNEIPSDLINSILDFVKRNLEGASQELNTPMNAPLYGRFNTIQEAVDFINTTDSAGLGQYSIL
ncbi:hypothetical protein [Larkinella sp. C7]|uniref:hypothetical protein n=1 Tax=Larkinella sp. C7 TaxID=2576607 RepID=UPI001111473C|nr:hypothetical protein [Larkinella sp. C7]